MTNPRVRLLFETGYLKSIFVHSDYESPEEMRKDLFIFAKSKNFVNPAIEKIDEERWLLKLTEVVEVKEPVPAKIPYEHRFYIIPYWGFWEFYTNVRRRVIDKVVGGLIEFLPKLEYKFIPPDRIISLAKEYEIDEMLAFTAKRDYFNLVQESELRITGDEVSLTLRSTPENIWNHYRKLVEEEAIGALTIGAVQLRIASGEKSCDLWIRTLGQIYQTAGSRDIFHDVRERLLGVFEQQKRWEQYIPQIEPQIVEEKGVTIRGQKIIRRGHPFSIKLSRPLEERQYLKIKGIFLHNTKKSGFIGTIEEEIKNVSFMVRTTDMRGGGDAIVSVKLGERDIIIDPQPATTIRYLEKLHRVILEKFDTRALFIEPKAE